MAITKPITINKVIKTKIVKLAPDKLPFEAVICVAITPIIEVKIKTSTRITIHLLILGQIKKK